MAKVREQQLRDALIDVDYPASNQEQVAHAVRSQRLRTRPGR